MATSKLELQEVVFQVLLENLKVGEIPENHEDGLNQCFYWKEATESYTKNRDKETGIIESREHYAPGTHTLQMLTQLPKENHLWQYFDRQVSTSLKPKNNNKTNASIHV